MTPQLACYLLTTCLEGGSNEWLDHCQPGLAGYQNPDNYTPDKIWLVRDDEGDSHKLTWADMLAALTIMPDRHLRDLTDDNWDADTADVWLQCALFKDIIYC